jgi:hypothetical protein
MGRGCCATDVLAVNATTQATWKRRTNERVGTGTSRLVVNNKGAPQQWRAP